jgi:hypothetical protein
MFDLRLKLSLQEKPQFVRQVCLFVCTVLTGYFSL